MNLRLRCLWTLTILLLLLTWISGMAGAQIGIEHPFLLDIPASYNSSLWMALWNINLTRIVNSPACWLNHNYYPWYNPLTQSCIPLLFYPWSYLYSPSKKGTEPVRPVFENLSLFKMGPLYAQIDEPYRYLFIADYTSEGMQVHARDGNTISCPSIFYLMIDPEEFFIYALDPNDPDDPVVKYWTGLGADPDLFGENDPNMAALFGRESFRVDLDLPVFADPNLRYGGHLAERFFEQATLCWEVSVQGADEIQTLHIAALPTDPYDGMPTYLPANYNAIEAISQYQRPSFPPGAVIALEAALWNSGISVWPNVAALDYTPEYFEDLIVTIEVNNGRDSDCSTFPISVVNYPMENYSPVPASDQFELTFYVGEYSQYVLQCIDPDCFIFSQAYNLYGQTPATTHVPWNTPGMAPRDDMSCLYWEDLSFPGRPGDYTNLHHVLWCISIISRSSGLISLTPQFEGYYVNSFCCSDSKGGRVYIEAELFCLPIDERSNHPPIILGGPTQPLTLVAGEEYILHCPNFVVEDPDGDKVYASCNIGNVGKAPTGDFMWRFQSSFPGTYSIEIIFFDIRGGEAIMKFPLEVKP